MVNCISKNACSRKRVQQLKETSEVKFFLNLKENENCVFSSTDESVGAKAPIVRDTKVAKGVVHHNHTIHNFNNVGCSEMLICVSDRLFL